MSSSLYRLGRAMARARWKAVGVWALLMLVAGSLAIGLGGAFSSQFEIPGTEAQEGLDVLSTRFPQMSGTSGQLVFVTADGSDIDEHRAQIEAVMDEAAGVEGMEAAPSPFDEHSPGTRNDADTAIIGTVQMAGAMGSFPDGSIEELEQIAQEASGDGLEVHLGGQILQSSEIPMGPSEVIGLLAALIILAVTFRSVVPAAIPIASAIVGVGVSMLAVMALAAGIDIPSVTISLGAMLGLAVGIDYALFILSRHRGQLAEGQDVVESIGRAIATSGSAVIFAGLTVIIALVGLFVTGIPFLTMMGMASAGTVAVSVVVALTLLPAIMGLLGERLRPRRIRRLMAENGGVLPAPDPQGAARRPVGTGWVQLATKIPALTIVLVVVAMAALALPIKDLRLGLPDLGTEKPDTLARQSYDLVAEEFGPGYNGPLLVTADIINSTDPLGVVDDLEERIAALDGVAEVQLATPNEGADMAVVVIIPEGAQTDASTAELVRTLRADADGWERELDISDVTVTGQTAVAIDITDRLSSALLPFAVFVVGLSLILLTIVFRSIWVPIKASLGYLLSVGAAFGVVAMIFEYGWGNAALNIHVVGPVISFMPIMCMGVLFGLAMDYEVFLVSRMREEYVHSGDARGAIERGFTGSAPVVIAAALIMFAVFASFVPEGSFMLQPIAVALAVGVLVDAFVVRMTLVPAVLALLGDRAWQLPRWLDRILPRIDVEGEGLVKVLEHRSWTAAHGASAIRLEDAVLPLQPTGSHHEDLSGQLGPLTGAVAPGTLLVVRSDDAPARAALLAGIGGRLRPLAGVLAVGDRLSPDDITAIQARTHWIGAGADVSGRLAAITARAAAGRTIVLAEIEDLLGAREGAVAHLEDLLEAGACVVVGSPDPRPGASSDADGAAEDPGDLRSPAEVALASRLRDPSALIALRVRRTRAAVLEGASS
ncbi:MMPL family transporter [Brachybacterium hainanense]|uniref:MMPL family transporter n=1 Tax=Brachybacterium hainanense TaxID=1541174 RepID=A0ABV6RBI8_9MICO